MLKGKIKEGKWNKMPGRMVKKAPLRKWYLSKTRSEGIRHMDSWRKGIVGRGNG